MTQNENHLDDNCCLTTSELQLCEQTEKRVAKEILQSLLDVVNEGINSNISDDFAFACIRIRTAIILKAQECGVEVE